MKSKDKIEAVGRDSDRGVVPSRGTKEPEPCVIPPELVREQLQRILAGLKESLQVTLRS